MVWNFVVLNGTKYCISESFDADSAEIYKIVHILRKLQGIITVFNASKN